jgi:hypothetical protein
MPVAQEVAQKFTDDTPGMKIPCNSGYGSRFGKWL